MNRSIDDLLVALDLRNPENETILQTYSRSRFEVRGWGYSCLEDQYPNELAYVMLEREDWAKDPLGRIKEEDEEFQSLYDNAEALRRLCMIAMAKTPDEPKPLARVAFEGLLSESKLEGATDPIYEHDKKLYDAYHRTKKDIVLSDVNEQTIEKVNGLMREIKTVAGLVKDFRYHQGRFYQGIVNKVRKVALNRKLLVSDFLMEMENNGGLVLGGFHELGENKRYFETELRLEIEMLRLRRNFRDVAGEILRPEVLENDKKALPGYILEAPTYKAIDAFEETARLGMEKEIERISPNN